MTSQVVMVTGLDVQ